MKKRRAKSTPKSDCLAGLGPAGNPELAKTVDAESSPKPGKRPSKRIWLFRLIALTVVPALTFGLLELGLRLFGFGYPTSFFIIWREPGDKAATYVENVHFGKRFFPAGLARKPVPVSLPIHKEPGTYRIFVLGESAAMGFPNPATSFSRILEVMLGEAFPGRRFEVINTAFVAINSHVALPIARECAGHQPDLFVVHLGNNEIVGPFGAAGVLGDYAPNYRLIRASLAVKATRSGQLLERLTHSLLPSGTPRSWGGMAMFQDSTLRADDARLDAMLANFRQNLGDICQCGEAVGADVVVCTIPVNLKDCGPFASRHQPLLGDEQLAKWNAAYQAGIQLEQSKKFSDALSRFQEASTIDDQFAELRFRMARCQLRLGRKKEAQREYSAARDLDALRFRTDSRINEAIREVVSERAPHAQLADAEKDFSAASESEIPGDDLFLEHVHMNFKGSYTLASSVFRKVSKILAVQLQPAPDRDFEPLSERECAERLAYGSSDRVVAYERIQGMLIEPPFTSQLDHEEQIAIWDARVKSAKDELDSVRKNEELVMHENAIKRRPDDWMIREQYADLLAESGEANLARREYQIVLEGVPQNYEVWTKMANLCVKLKKYEEAETCFRKSLAIDEEASLTYYLLAEVLAMKGKKREGLAIFTQRLQKDPNRAEVLTYLANYHLMLGELTEARRSIDEALQINADGPMSHIILGHVLKEQGDIAGAAEQYELAQKIQPRLRSQVSGFLAQLRNSTAQ
jgi:tetratricopeptide (TPR) repeat protein